MVGFPSATGLSPHTCAGFRRRTAVRPTCRPRRYPRFTRRSQNNRPLWRGKQSWNPSTTQTEIRTKRFGNICSVSRPVFIGTKTHQTQASSPEHFESERNKKMSDQPSATTTTAIHLSLQGKGGVGKSLIASLLAQYFKTRCETVQCIDTDPVNHTLAQYKQLNVQKIKLLRDGGIDQRGFDTLMETL